VRNLGTAVSRWRWQHFQCFSFRGILGRGCCWSVAGVYRLEQIFELPSFATSPSPNVRPHGSWAEMGDTRNPSSWGELCCGRGDRRLEPKPPLKSGDPCTRASLSQAQDQGSHHVDNQPGILGACILLDVSISHFAPVCGDPMHHFFKGICHRRIVAS